jgi:hypothetical protein
MALPITHRWIAVGNVLMRNPKRASQNAPTTTLEEVMHVARSLLTDNKQLRQFGHDKSRVMWFSNIEERDDFYWFLAEIGDQNVTGFSFLNFQTLESRDVNKRENEGGYYTAHIAISKAPLSKTSGHLLLAERVPGISLSSLKDHFSWLTKDERLQKVYQDEKGTDRKVSIVFEVDGYESGTIRDALRGGTLQDIEFVQLVERHEDGLDEYSIVRQSVHEARWVVKRQVSAEEAQSEFGKALNFLRGRFRRPAGGDAKMFIRIKTGAGQIRRTEVDEHDENVLEQAFIQHERVKDFDTPLAQRHDGLRDDMIKKMTAIADKLRSRDKVDA